jgi:hypothetical protein
VRSALGQTLEARAIELYAAQMALTIVACVGFDEECTVGIVSAFNLKNFEIAFGDLIDQFGINRHRIGFIE